MRFEYLLFNLLIVLGPVLAIIFYPKVNKLLTKPAVLSIGVAASLFVVWDIIVTGHFWEFNTKYFLGYKLLTIPFEEVLFFISVPFACLFLYVNFIEKFRNKNNFNPFLINCVSLVLMVFSVVFLFFGKYYTFAILLLLGLVWLSDHYLFKTHLVIKYVYWQYMGIVLLLTAFFNYYLTSRPVVIYNNSLNLNYRFLTIPVEDFFYSICLISLVLILYEYACFQENQSINRKD